MNRTDAEIKRMLRDGVRPAASGDEPLFSVMPSYVFHDMTDEDLDAIVAYLRAVPGVEHAVPPSGPEFQLSGPAVPLPDGVIPQPRADYVDQAVELGLPAPAFSGNITSDPQTGIGSWSVDDIVRVLRQGDRERDGGRLYAATDVAWFSRVTSAGSTQRPRLVPSFGLRVGLAFARARPPG